MSGKRRRQDFCGKGEPLRTVFTRVSEKGQEESRGASVTDAAGMDVPEDPEMSAGNWETLGKTKGGEPWLVLVLFLLIFVLSERKQPGHLEKSEATTTHPISHPCLEKGKDQKEVVGGYM